MTRRFLYLVRHGQYMNEAAEGEEPDGRLTHMGREQAAAVGKHVQSLPINIIHHSTLRRAVETAVIIGQQLPQVAQRPSDLLRECIPSVPEPFRQHFADMPPEHVAQGTAQAAEAFATFFQPPMAGAPDSHELIVGHGNLLAYFVCEVLKAPTDSWLMVGQDHCGITAVLLSDSGWMKLLYHNDTGHLPPESRTE